MGGETHLPDLEMITPVLENIQARYGSKIKYRFFGVCPPQRLLNNPSTEWTKVNEINYQIFASFFVEQVIDIFIAPLCDNRFNRAKSGIKYLEYSVLSVPGIYSRLPAYEKIVDHSINGFLVTHNEEWISFLCQLIESRELRNQIGKASQENLKDNWLLSKHSQEWSNAYKQVLSSRDRSRQRSRHAWANVVRQSAQWCEEIEKELIKETNQGLAIKYELNEILNSRSWRLISGFHQLRRKFTLRKN
jgi:hypothetical protein